MGSLEKKRNRIQALYGRDPMEDRLIDVKLQKSLKMRYRVLLIILTIIAVFLLAVCLYMDKQGYVFGIGQLNNGEKFYGLVDIAKVQSQYSENPDNLDFSYINVVDILIVGGLATIVIYIMLAIVLFDKISWCNKSIRAFNDYQRRQAILEEEERDRQQEMLHNKILNAPVIEKKE